MNNVATQKASQLSDSIRSAVEELLGRAVAADEEISVIAVPPQQAPPSRDRATIARQLEELLNRRAERVKDLPEQEVESAIDEALNHVRHSRACDFSSIRMSSFEPMRKAKDPLPNCSPCEG